MPSVLTGWSTGNGQAFNSWPGYKLPPNSMSEQIYSCLAHGALGLVWWGQWRSNDTRYALPRQTKPYNAEYAALVAQLEGCELAQAEVALLYSWTTMSQALNDEHTYDTLLTYMMLVQSGYPVDLAKRRTGDTRVCWQTRGYKALLAMGCSALPTPVHQAIDRFVQPGRTADRRLCADAEWTVSGRSTVYGEVPPARPRLYTLPDQVPVPVQVGAAPLYPPKEAQIIARFEDGSPAICRIPRGQGAVILAGSYLGWDYSNYPGYYDLAAMFPFHIRRDAAYAAGWLDTLEEAGIVPACPIDPSRCRGGSVAYGGSLRGRWSSWSTICKKPLRLPCRCRAIGPARSADGPARQVMPRTASNSQAP